MSVSYGQCETVNGAAANAAYNSAYQQAAAKAFLFSLPRVTAARLVATNSVSEATHGVGANAFASTPYNVAVRLARTSTIPIRARTAFTGTLRTLPRSARQLLISRKFRGIIRAPAPCSQRILALAQRTAQNSLCNDPPMVYRLQTTVAAAVVQALARPVRRPLPEW